MDHYVLVAAIKQNGPGEGWPYIEDILQYIEDLLQDVIYFDPQICNGLLGSMCWNPLSSMG
jgi:hypothetical protein